MIPASLHRKKVQQMLKRTLLNHTRHSDAAAEAVINQLNAHEQVLKKYGYDGEYPKKEVIITETNIPGKQSGENIGSPEAQRNYLIKVAVLGQTHFDSVGRICSVKV